jgi:hypothetical protein
VPKGHGNYKTEREKTEKRQDNSHHKRSYSAYLCHKISVVRLKMESSTEFANYETITSPPGLYRSRQAKMFVRQTSRTDS